MKLTVSALLALLLGVSAALLVAACGSSTKTVSVAGTPPDTQTISTGAHKAGSTSATTTPARNTTAAGAGAPAATTTRTAPEPAFTEKQGSSEGLSAATAVLQAKGYTPTDTSVYHADQVLRVLVGSHESSGEQAFFFVNGRYIGTDTKEPSAMVDVLSQGETEVTLGYPLYRKGDPPGNPSGGQAKVRFQLNNGKLAALDPIPPATGSTAALTRR